MTALTLTLTHAPRHRVDLSPLTPDRLSGLAPRQIGAIELGSGKRAVRTDQLFDIAGNDSSDLVIENACDRLDRIGQDMSSGRVRIRGNAGAYLARGMRGGRIEVSGGTGIFAASGMSGGVLVVGGDAGEFLAAALPGEHRGMRGGAVVVRGNAGDRLGDRMRRGLVLVEGDAGDYCACRMGAGTIAVLGSIGAQCGFAMNRGTLLLRTAPAQPSPTFNDCGEHDFGFLRLLLAHCATLSERFAALPADATRATRLVGDRANGGKGEVLILG